MLRRTVIPTLSSVHDMATGVESHYRPKFRPRRLVMPVDPQKIYSEKRFDPKKQKIRKIANLKKAAGIDGAIKLGTVPEERSVADEYRLCLEACKQFDWFNPDKMKPRPFVRFTKKHDLKMVLPVGTVSASDAALVTEAKMPDDEKTTQSTSLVVQAATNNTAGNEITQQTYTLWDLLGRTPLDSPAHGPLANKGKAMVKRVIVDELSRLYPRLRSGHLDLAVQHLASYMTSIRFAATIGFASRAGIERDLSLFREISALKLKVGRAKLELRSGKERWEKEMANTNDLYYWQRQLKQTKAALIRLGVDHSDVIPRVEWMHDQMMAFIAFVAKTEGEISAVNLIRRVFMPAVASQHELNAAKSSLARLIRDSRKMAATGGKSQQPLVDSLVIADARAILKLLQSDDFLNGPANETVHPLSARADQWRLRMASSANYLSVEDYVDGFVEEEVQRHQQVAPPFLVKLLGMAPHSQGVNHAFKEAQIILKYSDEIPDLLRDAPLDFERSVVEATTVVETDATKKKVIDKGQNFETKTFTEMKFYAGDKMLGMGRDRHDVGAMNAAARHFLLNYYLKSPKMPPLTFKQVGYEPPATSADHESSSAPSEAQERQALKKKAWSPRKFYTQVEQASESGTTQSTKKAQANKEEQQTVLSDPSDMFF